MEEFLLHYLQPAEHWEEALPIGNGRLGAMIFGRTTAELLRLNEETLWTGFPCDWDNPDSAKHLQEVRDLIYAGKYAEATKLASKYLVCRKEGNFFGTYRCAGDLILLQPGAGALLSRRLDLEHGVSVTDAEHMTRTHFASNRTNTLISRVQTKDAPFALDVRFDSEGGGDGIPISEILASPVNGRTYMGPIVEKDTSAVFPGVQTAGNDLLFSQQFSGQGALCWCMRTRIETDGAVTPLEDGLRLTGATYAVLYTAVATSYDGRDPARDVLTAVNAASLLGYDALLAQAEEYFAARMHRSSLTLESNPALHALPTDQRLDRIAEGADDPGFAELYFNLGKYLLIASSSPESRLPANLQGIWTRDNTPPWNSDYHTNINLQMNYWHAEVTGLGDCTAPLFSYLFFLTGPGSKTARVMYGCGGWVAHHTTSPWGFTSAGANPIYGNFVLGGVWCCRNILEHWRYTSDTAFLKQYWPVVHGAAEFLLDVLQKDPRTGYLVLCPSGSPENRFADPATGEQSCLCAGTAMDTEIMTDFFAGLLDAAPAAEEQEDFIARVCTALHGLSPIRIGKNGAIMEWSEDFDEVDPGHRHMSHLYGLYPASLIDRKKTPALFCAAEKTIQRRLHFGGGHTGWSRAWIINFYARLHDGEEALRQLQLLFSKSTLPNLFDNHPPFQIDGNFGGCAGIIEMLLNTATGELLPALPSAWKNGSFRGFRLPGGKTLSCTWQNGKVVSKEISE